MHQKSGSSSQLHYFAAKKVTHSNRKLKKKIEELL